MDILREEFCSCDDPEDRPTLYYQLDTNYRKSVLNAIEPDVCCDLYSRLYSDADRKDALVLMDDALRNKLLMGMTDKEVVSTLNLMPSEQLATSIRWLEESRRIRVLNCMSERELSRATVYLEVRNLSRYYYPCLVAVDPLLEKCDGCQKLYDLGETQWIADCKVHTVHLRCKSDENECPICTPPKNILSCQSWDHLAAIKPIRIMVLGLISWPKDLIRYALVRFKEDGPMYWYKAQVLERYFDDVFVEELKAFRSLPVDLRFHKV